MLDQFELIWFDGMRIRRYYLWDDDILEWAIRRYYLELLGDYWRVIYRWNLDDRENDGIYVNVNVRIKEDWIWMRVNRGREREDILKLCILNDKRNALVD